MTSEIHLQHWCGQIHSPTSCCVQGSRWGSTNSFDLMLSWGQYPCSISLWTSFSFSGLSSYGLGSPTVRVRDVAAVYGFLLLVHPAHLTYAATERHTAYYLPHIPVNLTSSKKLSEQYGFLCHGWNGSLMMIEFSILSSIFAAGHWSSWQVPLWLWVWTWQLNS